MTQLVIRTDVVLRCRRCGWDSSPWPARTRDAFEEARHHEPPYTSKSCAAASSELEWSETVVFSMMAERIAVTISSANPDIDIAGRAFLLGWSDGPAFHEDAGKRLERLGTRRYD